ncbi:hypothetical protein [Nocardia sp. BMG51109]|uniref:hypothetical protein n=1 Tax=Nocardia sp. BMG51109 TaxID=1056816 RepID=UPI000463EA9C|nr:hypothetical protein [Nocardia sp. BMG51109]
MTVTVPSEREIAAALSGFVPEAHLCTDVLRAAWMLSSLDRWLVLDAARTLDGDTAPETLSALGFGDFRMHTLAMHQTIALTGQETHYAPETPFSVERAHLIVQFHIACRAKRCPRKAAALQVLAGAGRLVPSTTRPR